MSKGYIKLHRSILDWAWYRDVNTRVLFIHLLLTVNLKEGEYMGVKVPSGSVITTLPELSQQSNLSIQSVRTAITHLKSTGEVTVTKFPKFSMITVNNWSKYQTANRQTNSQPTGNQQAANRQLTVLNNQRMERMEEYKNAKSAGAGARNNKSSAYGNEGASYDIDRAVHEAETGTPTVKKKKRHSC